MNAMTLDDPNDLPLPDLRLLVAHHGALAVGWAYLRAALARKQHPPDLPLAVLSDHLRRDIGLGPAPTPMPPPPWRL